MILDTQLEQRMYLTRTPKYLQSMFPNVVWQKKEDQKVIYLTFDDGPIPESTPFILETLRRYNAKATFFCVGDNIEKYGFLHARIVKEGHSVGSHTFNHLSGWTTRNISYYKNVKKAADLTDSKLFRPPYGRITPKQIRFLAKYYDIIMWDVLSADFDSSIDPETCYKNVIKNGEKGSIIVFHDSLKAIGTVKTVLPKVLEYYTDKGFRFKGIMPKP